MVVTDLSRSEAANKKGVKRSSDRVASVEEEDEASADVSLSYRQVIVAPGSYLRPEVVESLYYLWIATRHKVLWCRDDVATEVSSCDFDVIGWLQAVWAPLAGSPPRFTESGLGRSSWRLSVTAAWRPGDTAVSLTPSPGRKRATGVTGKIVRCVEAL